MAWVLKLSVKMPLGRGISILENRQVGLPSHVRIEKFKLGASSQLLDNLGLVEIIANKTHQFLCGNRVRRDFPDKQFIIG